MNKTAIQWSTHSWNPVSGCSKVSPGCKHCYAEGIANRFWDERKFTDVRWHEERIEQPLHARKPRLIFVNSMSDFFHEDIPVDILERCLNVMLQADWHIYFVLTKRSPRMRALLSTRFAAAALQPHIWWGVSVENRKYGLPRIEDLHATTAAVKFLSIEPLLEDLGPLKLKGIDWVIVGGESGPNFRYMDPNWARLIRDQCQAQGVAFFFKQWSGVHPHRLGRLLDGREWNEYPGTANREEREK